MSSSATPDLRPSGLPPPDILAVPRRRRQRLLHTHHHKTVVTRQLQADRIAKGRLLERRNLLRSGRRLFHRMGWLLAGAWCVLGLAILVGMAWVLLPLSPAAMAFKSTSSTQQGRVATGPAMPPPT